MRRLQAQPVSSVCVSAITEAELRYVRIPAMADTESDDDGQRRSEATQVLGLSLRVSAMGVEGRVFSK